MGGDGAADGLLGQVLPGRAARVVQVDAQIRQVLGFQAFGAGGGGGQGGAVTRATTLGALVAAAGGGAVGVLVVRVLGGVVCE